MTCGRWCPRAAGVSTSSSRGAWRSRWSHDGDDAPDLADVAAQSGLSAAEVVARHAGIDYRVFMLGFLPGFAYLGSLDDALVMPRLRDAAHQDPRRFGRHRGAADCVYPMASPGGWRSSARTDVRMFDPDRPHGIVPGSAGDAVRFVPVPAFADRTVPPRSPHATHGGLARRR